MSYILDALKKSEQERQRGNVPDIKSVHSASVAREHDTRRSWWIWLFVLVLAVNGVIFTVVFMGNGGDSALDEGGQAINPPSLANETPAEIQPQTITKAAQPDLPETTAENAGTEPAGRQTAEETVAQQPSHPRVIFSKEPLDIGQDSAEEATAVVSDPPAVKQEELSEKPFAGQAEQAVLIAELPDSIRQKIPNIEFTGHVYSSSVERRSVMINGKKMREGDVVGSGLTLQAVTPEGAEFEYQGYRFKLNALQDWSYR
jgi:general secretion pathway protein B